MCGLIAAVPAYDEVVSDDGAAAAMDALLSDVAESSATLAATGTADATRAGLHALNASLRQLVTCVSTPAALYSLVVDDGLRARAIERIDAATVRLRAVNTTLDVDRPGWTADDIEPVQAQLRLAQDLAWTVREDRLGSAERMLALVGEAVDRAVLSPNAAVGYFALDAVLEALDRLEVRGRDSAGVHLWIRLSQEDLATVPAVADRDDPLFRSSAVHRTSTGLSIVYKTAAMVGRLGDNVRALRAAISNDPLLPGVLALPSARVTVVAHTRWASVGRVSQPNAHPLNSVVRGDDTPACYTIAALNGDIDNYLELGAAAGLSAGTEITTDAKLIPVMVGRRLVDPTADPAAVFHECLSAYRGSMAISVQTDAAPETLLLGARGGGQGLYVGLSTFGYLVASEVFGLVSLCDRYLRLDHGTDGVVVAVDQRGNGTPAGIRVIDATGIARPIDDAALRVPEVATRDITRGGFERYLEKELADAPSSFRKTLRGRVHDHGTHMSVHLPDSTLPPDLRAALRAGEIDEIVVIGQGTAAVAASGIGHLMETQIGHRVRVRSMPATELSAWHLHKDLGRTCLIPISQSGTTTDTNRTVDIARQRGARVVAIVNRRDSDLVAKSDGVLYTSDGRDIEMAVASTKAFYAQVAAGMLLSVGIAKELGALDEHAEDAQLRLLLEMPAKLEELEKSRATIAAVAEKTAGRYRYNAVLGSGPNRIAAAEVRIKLSELCYCGVSADAVEDKKHIDLSAESLVLVCGAGTPVTQVHDLVKEVDIFAAHHNQPVMIVDAGTRDLWSNDLVIEVPAAHPALAWLLSTAAGHYFAYYTARAIDGYADNLRLALTALDSTEDGGRAVASARLTAFLADVQVDRYRGVLSAATAIQLAMARLLLDEHLPIQQLFPGKEQGDEQIVIRQALSAGIDELTRSIDSVKHQAKTVTVGTSRSGANLFDNLLAKGALEVGADREGLSYSTLVALRDYADVTAAVRGAVRYSVSGTAAQPRIRTMRKTGIAADLVSRADSGTDLSGSKKLAADTRTARLERGLSDGRLVLIIPEQSGSRLAAISLLHLELVPKASAAALLAALNHQGSRLPELQAAITERNRPFSGDDLAELDPAIVLLDPVGTVASALRD